MVKIHCLKKIFSETIQLIHKILPTKVKDAAHRSPCLFSITKYFLLLKYILQNTEQTNSNQKGKKIKGNCIFDISQCSSHKNK